MKNTFKKVVITGALVLAPVVAAGSAMAAPLNVAAQAPNQNVTNIDFSGFDFNKLLQGNEQNNQSLSDMLNKLFSNKKPVATQPDVAAPDKSKPATPAPSKPAPTAPATGTANQNQSVTANSDFAAQVVDLVNQERAKAGLQPLKSDAALTDVAMVKAKDMYDNNYFDHNSPTLGSPFDLMKSKGIQYRTAGENIAKGQRTPEEVMNAWMNSEGHRKNILNASYTSIGVAYYNGEWVQEFTG
ncbi:CAP domain-containing protein [Paenibacillus apiarius]|uniref:CAP domain-containing protein n=1 Tax=Paenibacillus apiarius TaxID=46240 RepID=A0ABT4DW59_9BACL|nr:CAP domain-containing protein [Paenibacillus apiarius]MBN3526661.1 serine protease [Paenibacillus apiarius]MCY9513078.1 CAP domain-containing protein [Paenibacillus apiarius]MCY9521564.1 CAP domain-containing protein [Paenibacillus apiarius]MCY9551718.1 CAP domain-containing protein [Paenibacillus apiarius]MCY9560494.1 CAP domain-containing protein [Paenibacillus apiarius]